MVSQGSQSLALGLAKTAASQLDEFVRAHPFFLGKAECFCCYRHRLVRSNAQRTAYKWRTSVAANSL